MLLEFKKKLHWFQECFFTSPSCWAHITRSPKPLGCCEKASDWRAALALLTSFQGVLGVGGMILYRLSPPRGAVNRNTFTPPSQTRTRSFFHEMVLNFQCSFQAYIFMTPINWWNPLQLGQICPVFWRLLLKTDQTLPEPCLQPLGKMMEELQRSRFFLGELFLEIHWISVWNFENLRNVGWCKVTCSKGYH